ncbi:MAG: VWA domain-containing protein [Spirochaetales bacterium]|nr:VWA domain-containing protein [Spirochaetales bacterium]
MKRILLATIILLLFQHFLLTENNITITISQIDNSTLLFDQKIKLYVNVTDVNSNPVQNLKEENFTLSETIEYINEDGQVKENEYKRNITLKQRMNEIAGINLLLLLDNSPSMYWNNRGKETTIVAERRITAAKQAILHLLDELEKTPDRIGFISFNEKTENEIPISKDKSRIKSIIDSQFKERSGWYTELYESLYVAAENFEKMKGRNVIILLTDGKNESKSDSDYFQKRYGLDGAIRNAQEKKISVFTLGLSDRVMEDTLKRIAGETGGIYFFVQNAEDVKDYYSRIRGQVLNEYYISYNATMEPAEYKKIKVSVDTDQYHGKTERNYYFGTVFGTPLKNTTVFQLLLFDLTTLISALGVVTFIFIFFTRKKKRGNPFSLQYLYPNRKISAIVFRKNRLFSGGKSKKPLYLKSGNYHLYIITNNNTSSPDKGFTIYIFPDVLQVTRIEDILADETVKSYLKKIYFKAEKKDIYKYKKQNKIEEVVVHLTRLEKFNIFLWIRICYMKHYFMLVTSDSEKVNDLTINNIHYKSKRLISGDYIKIPGVMSFIFHSGMTEQGMQ